MTPKKIIVHLLRKREDPIILRHGSDKMKLIPIDKLGSFHALLTLSNGSRKFKEIKHNQINIRQFVANMTINHDWEIDFNEELTA